MSTLTTRLPDDTAQRLKSLAQSRGLSMNKLIVDSCRLNLGGHVCLLAPVHRTWPWGQSGAHSKKPRMVRGSARPTTRLSELAGLVLAGQNTLHHKLPKFYKGK